MRFKMKHLSGPARLRQLCLVVLCFVGASLPHQVFGKCSALPILTKTIDTLDDLYAAETLTPDQLARVAAKLRPMPVKLSSIKVEERLQIFGLERRTNAARQLAPKVAELALVAQTGRMEAVRSFMTSAEFRRALYLARDLANMICGPNAESGWSAYAKRIITITGRFGLGPPGTFLFAVTRNLVWVMLAFLLVLAFWLLWFRRSERDMRRNKRFPCLIPVKVEDDADLYALEVVDISQAGVNIHNQLEWPCDHRLTVSIEDLSFAGTVRWSNAHYAGVQFDVLIPQDQFKALLMRYPAPFDDGEEEASSNIARL